MLPSLIVGLLLLAAAAWIAVSLIRTVRHVWAVQSRLRALARRVKISGREIALAAESTAAQERRQAAASAIVEERRQAIAALEKRMMVLKSEGAPEYRILSLHSAENDRVFLLSASVGTPPRTERWAAFAADADAARRLLAASLEKQATITVESHL